MVIDESLRFKEHVAYAAARAQKMLTSLSRLMPNVGGPREPRRRLLVSVVHSVLLYGAPVWAETLDYVKPNVDELTRVQRRATLRSICAYRTVSRVAANVLASIPPIDLLAKERNALFLNRRELQSAQDANTSTPREVTMREWQRRIDESDPTEKGLWTRTLIKNVNSWCARSHGQLSYHMTQAFSGHGCFGTYLLRIGKEDNACCHHCPAAVDDPGHTLFQCPSWEGLRNEVHQTLGGFDQESMIKKMLDRPENWKAVERFTKEVILLKEEAERSRRAEQVLVAS